MSSSNSAETRREREEHKNLALALLGIPVIVFVHALCLALAGAGVGLVAAQFLNLEMAVAMKKCAACGAALALAGLPAHLEDIVDEVEGFFSAALYTLASGIAFALVFNPLAHLSICNALGISDWYLAVYHRVGLGDLLSLPTGFVALVAGGLGIMVGIVEIAWQKVRKPSNRGNLEERVKPSQQVEEFSMGKAIGWAGKALFWVGIVVLVLFVKFFPQFQNVNRQIDQAQAAQERMESMVAEAEAQQAELERAKEMLREAQQEAIVGRWKSVADSAHVMHFSDDGSFTTSVPRFLIGPAIVHGTFRIVDADTLEFSGEGQTAQWDYTLSTVDDRLELRAPVGEWERFKRVN